MARDPHFTPELFRFLAALKRHNRRPWFLTNKERYERDVRQPALRFIADFAPRLWALSPHFEAGPRSLFRIYRDIRFSHDKRPYKTHVGIHFSLSAGPQRVHTPGFYLHLEPESCFAAAGLWHPDSPTLRRVRDGMVREPGAWARVRRQIEPECRRLTRPPRGYPPGFRFLEDLKLKDFVASVELTEREVCRPDFPRRFEKACRQMLPLVEFLSRALGLRL